MHWVMGERYGLSSANRRPVTVDYQDIHATRAQEKLGTSHR
jgi:hypothetical protein